MHAFVLLLLTVADPELGAEQPVDAPRVVRSAGMEGSPAIATIPGGAVVVFRSERRGQADLWMTRVDESGLVRTPARRVSDSDELNPLVPPSVACVADRCVVAWQTGEFPKGDLRFRRFTLDGVSLDQFDQVLTAQPHHEGEPKLIATATDVVALFSVARGAGPELLTTRISLDGALSNQTAMGMGSAGKLRQSQAGFELVCIDQLERVVLRRFSPTLEEQGQQVIATPQSALESFSSVDLAVAGDRLLASWTRVVVRPGLGSELEVFGWLDGSTTPFPIVALPEVAFAPSLVVDGAQFRVTMMSRGAATIVSRLVDPTTGALGPLTTLSSRRLPQPAVLVSASLGSSVLVAFDVFEHGAGTIDAAIVSAGAPRSLLLVPAGNTQRQVAMTAFGSGFLAVWQDTQNLELHADDLFAARLSSEGHLLAPPFPVVVDPAFQGFSSVAATPSMALVAWYDERSGSAIRAARIDPTGTVLDTTPLVIAEASSGPTNQLAFPVVGTDGSGFLVVFSDQRDDTLRAVHVGSDGVVSPSKIVREGAGTADVAFGAGHYLVVSTDEDVNTSKFEVWITVLNPDGSVLTPASRLVTGDGLRSFPRIAFGGGEFLTVWADGRRTSGASVQSDVRALTLDVAGKPSGLPFDVSSTGVDQEPAIAFDGASFQVTWFTFTAPLTTSVLRAVVRREVVLSTTPVSTLPRLRQVVPRVAFNAEKGLVAFERFEASAEAQRLVVRTSATSRETGSAIIADPTNPTPPPLGLPRPFGCRCAASPASALLGALALILASRKRSR
ncbi:MAG: hypothetical protein JNM69_15280 [Archangium sp.]|nr:hypothetical protein [Archangium sp.]